MNKLHQENYKLEKDSFGVTHIITPKSQAAQFVSLLIFVAVSIPLISHYIDSPFNYILLLVSLSIGALQFIQMHNKVSILFKNKFAGLCALLSVEIMVLTSFLLSDAKFQRFLKAIGDDSRDIFIVCMVIAIMFNINSIYKELGEDLERSLVAK